MQLGVESHRKYIMYQSPKRKILVSGWETSLFSPVSPTRKFNYLSVHRGYFAPFCSVSRCGGGVTLCTRDLDEPRRSALADVCVRVPGATERCC